MPRKRTILLATTPLVALLATALGTVAVKAQGSRNVWDGTYSAAQAERGKAVYAANCAACHGEQLSGIDVAPPLVGSAFLNNWNSTTAADLFARIHDTMPLNAPGTLSAKATADVEAYLFQANGFPAGQTDLPPNAAMLGGTTIIAQKP